MICSKCGAENDWPTSGLREMEVEFKKREQQLLIQLEEKTQEYELLKDEAQRKIEVIMERIEKLNARILKSSDKKWWHFGSFP